jgi:hypothetical protein
MGNLIHNFYRDIKGGFFTEYLKLGTLTLFTEESSLFTSSKRLATMKSFPSMNCFRYLCCSGMETISKRVASCFMLAN